MSHFRFPRARSISTISLRRLLTSVSWPTCEWIMLAAKIQLTIRLHFRRRRANHQSPVWRPSRRASRRSLAGGQVSSPDRPCLKPNSQTQSSVWKPIKGPLNDWPLGLCDTRSVDYERDTIPADVVFDNFVTENVQIIHSPDLQWYYLPDHNTTEALIFKNGDSKEGPAAGMKQLPSAVPISSYAMVTDESYATRLPALRILQSQGRRGREERESGLQMLCVLC